MTKIFTFPDGTQKRMVERLYANGVKGHLIDVSGGNSRILAHTGHHVS